MPLRRDALVSIGTVVIVGKRTCHSWTSQSGRSSWTSRRVAEEKIPCHESTNHAAIIHSLLAALVLETTGLQQWREISSRADHETAMAVHDIMAILFVLRSAC